MNTMANTLSESETRPGVQAAPGRSGAKSGDAPPSAMEPSLKGTFAAVMLLGGFIAVSWALVFALFLSRN
jgi:hypothetical protein